MPIMTWDKTLDIGVEPMNAEHRDILDAMNRIYDAHAAGQKGAAIDHLVARLGEITTKHFADEERYMEKIGFPALKPHRLIHGQLLQEFGKHAAAIKAAGGTANQDFFLFLKRWLTAHIKGIDIKYGQHAKQAA